MPTALRISFQDAASATGLARLMHMAVDDLGRVLSFLPADSALREDAGELSDTVKQVLSGTLPGRLISLSHQAPQAMEHLNIYDVLMLINQTVSLKSLTAYMGVLAQLKPEYLSLNRISPLAQDGLLRMAAHLPLAFCPYQDIWQAVTQMHFDGFWTKNKQRHDLLFPLRIEVRFSELTEDDAHAISHMTTKILGRSGDPSPQIDWADGHTQMTVRSLARLSNVQTLQNALRSGFGEHIDGRLTINGGALFTNAAERVMPRSALTYQS